MTGDEETDEILQEMKDEGLEIPAFAGTETTEQAQAETEVTDPELEESEEESEEEAGEKSTEEESSTEGEEEEEDDDESEEEESDEDEEEEDESAGEGKGKKLTLVQKFKKERKLRKAAETALAGALAAKSDEDFDKEIAAFAKDHGMKVEAAKGLINLAAKRAGLPQDVMADIQASRTERRDQMYWGDQRKKFDKDFNANVLPVLQSQGLKEADIKKVYETLNADESNPNWAWSKSNKGKSLVQLALNVRRAGGTRTSSESGGRRTRTPSGKAPEDMTEEDINSMSDEDFDKFSDDLGKQSKSVVHRS